MKRPLSWSSFLIILITLTISFSACKEETIEEPPVFNTTAYEMSYPDYFPELAIPDNNKMTEEGVLLGRHLYYDDLLSKGGPLEGKSCSSCHHQSSSFSKGASGTSVLPHQNLAWNTNFLWDGKISGTIEDILKFEVEDFFQADLNNLRDDPKYPPLYEAAFGTEEITFERTEYAMSQWFRSLVSYETEFDSVIIMQGNDTYSDKEAEGYLIFFSERGDCFHCHTLPLMSDNNFRNIGLESDFVGMDQGRFGITLDSADLGKFKVPSLRNIEFTSPYMHDGRFSTLEEVVEHYNSGVKKSTTLDPIMTKPGKELGLQLDAEEKASLVAFLKTLSDYQFTSDPKFAKPF